MEVLSIKKLTKRYPRFTLDGVSFDVHQGEIMGFIGRNGAGKTTTLKSILNFVHPDSGEIRFFDKAFNENEQEIKRRIGYVSGGIDYYVQKKLSLITRVTKRFYSNWDYAAYSKYLKMFELDESKKPSELSAGMKVKYNLALALSHRAELLILDEPTSGLDPVSRDDLLDVFLGLSREGVSILFSTHITSDLDKCADRITYIKSGRILASEEIEQFAGKYRLMELTSEQMTQIGSQGARQELIGCKEAKHGYSAIIKTEDAQKCGLMSLTKDADLETIMVHIEKE